MAQYDKQLLVSDPLYRFFTDKIFEIESEIRRNSESIKKLSEKQESLKRGRSKMVELRKELVSRSK